MTAEIAFCHCLFRKQGEINRYFVSSVLIFWWLSNWKSRHLWHLENKNYVYWRKCVVFL